MKVSAWLRAQLVLAGVMGVCAAVGLALMRVPYFFVIALVAAIGETIPIVGPIIGGVTAVVIALGVSPKLALAVGGYFVVLHQLEANILVPMIMERRVGISPVTVIIALLMGGALLGLVGAILAVPTAAILSVVIEELAASTVVGSDVAGVDEPAVNPLPVAARRLATLRVLSDHVFTRRFEVKVRRSTVAGEAPGRQGERRENMAWTSPLVLRQAQDERYCLNRSW
jgi:hypothetical protein